jgi:hypothetical protein
MKIVHIFGPKQNPDEGLWALEQEGEAMNEFEKIFEIWQDAEHMHACCLHHLEDLQAAFGYAISPEEAAAELMDEAEELMELLVDLGTNQLTGANLQHLFKPLDNREVNLAVLQLSKGSAKSRIRKNPKLRIYAVRIGENTYIVTGGAIKLTHKMEERPHTQKQLLRLTGVKDWLKGEGIYYPEDLNDLS